MIERRLLKNVDFVLIFVVLFIMVAGLLMIYSATRTNAWGDPFYFAKRQALWMVLSLAVVIIFLGFDYTGFPRWSSIMYLVNLGLLAAVLLVGKQALGAQSWIQVGPFVVQPSEFAKIMIILTLANHLARYEGRIETWWDFLSPFIHVGVPVLLILRQPDLGTALVFLAILFGMLFVAGAPLGRLLGVFGGGLALAVGAIVGHLKYGWWIPLKDYQLKRLIVFVDPGVDPMGAGYHIIQSRIAIGSGGILGKGLFAGTQNQLDFLPERHTDFIFSVIGEELGFVGGALLLVLLFVLLWRGIIIASKAKDLYGTLVATGVVSLYTFHILVNVGMAVGVMPVTGLPLPFVSYGGSSLLSNSIGLALLLNVYMRRRKILF